MNLNVYKISVPVGVKICILIFCAVILSIMAGGDQVSFVPCNHTSQCCNQFYYNINNTKLSLKSG